MFTYIGNQTSNLSNPVIEKLELAVLQSCQNPRTRAPAHPYSHHRRTFASGLVRHSICGRPGGRVPQ